jgi:uncharacterized protein YbcI
MQTSETTRGQLERTLSQRVEALYRDQLGHRPTKITCRIFDDKIVIVLEEAVTQPEQLLANSGQEELAEQVRTDLNKALEPQLAQLIEEVVSIPVIDLLSDAKVETGRTGMIVILEAAPQVRQTNNEAKAKKPRPSDLDGSEA